MTETEISDTMDTGAELNAFDTPEEETTEEIDLFHKKLENFNYNIILFKKKAIKKYSNNIQRLIKTSGWEKFGIALIQSLLEDDSFKKSKPYLFGDKIGKIIRF